MMVWNRSYARGFVSLRGDRALVSGVAIACCIGMLATGELVAIAAERAHGTSHVLADVRIEKNGGPIFVDVAIEAAHDRPASTKRPAMLTMMLDTGATNTCFHTAHREMLGKRVGIQAATSLGHGFVEAFEAPVTRIGELELYTGGVAHVDASGKVSVRPKAVACIDLDWLTPITGKKVDGLLGMDVLRSRVVSVDFDQGRLRFHSSAPDNVGEPIPLLWRGERGAQRPYVDAAFGSGADQEFLVDTGGIGNVSIAMSNDLFKIFRGDGRLAPVVPAILRGESVQIGRIDGRQNVSIARAGAFLLADYRHTGLLVISHPHTSAISLAYLSRYLVTFDFPKSVMFLRPGRSFNRHDVWYDLTSFVVSQRKDGIVVDDVRQGGWGAIAGIRTGDLLVRVNGQDTEQLTLFSIRRILAIEGRQTLDIRRDGAEQRLILDLTAEIERFSSPISD
jgi:hypothetical protein